MLIDLGDAQLHIELRIPGLRPIRMRRHWSVEIDSTTGDRVPSDRQHTFNRSGDDRPEFGVSMDLHADKKRSVEARWTDEVGNPVDAPVGASVTWQTDAPDVLAVTVSDDGQTATVAAIGVLGRGHVRATVSHNGRTFVGEDEVIVIPGDAERISLTFGEEEEVTPDDTEPSEPTPPTDPEPVI